VRRKLAKVSRRVEKRHGIALAAKLPPLRMRRMYAPNATHLLNAPTIDAVLASSELAVAADGHLCGAGTSFGTSTTVFLGPASGDAVVTNESWSFCASSVPEGWDIVRAQSPAGDTTPAQTAEPISIR